MCAIGRFAPCGGCASVERMKPLRVFLAVCLGSTLLRAAPLPTWHGDPARGAAELEAQWKIVADENSAVPIRGVIRFALEATGLSWHPERALVALKRARAIQDLDSASKTLGNFKWKSDQERVFDLNAVEFASQLMGFMRTQQADKLTPEERALLDTMLTDALPALRSHVVKIEYTNIFVMKAWDLIAAGEALGRPEVAADGYKRFDDWLQYTARHGLGEYGAVTYYGVDLDSLALIARFAQRPEAREKAMTAIRYLWTDIAANWWAPGDRLGGANSRSYDYLYGSGYLEAHTWTAGWLRQRPTLEVAGWLSADKENLCTLRDAVTLPPPAEWTDAIRAQLPRLVTQRWGEGPEHQAVNWIGREVSLASSGASHGSDERTLVANLGTSPAVPQLTLFMDGRGDPFGTKKTANAAAQAKALHLTPFIATVQRGAEVLQVLSDEPMAPKTKRKPGDLACFLAQLTVPAAAEVWIDDARVIAGSPEKPTLIPRNAVVSIRLGGGAIAVRFLVATTTDGAPARIEYVVDDPKSAARRITVVHSASEPTGRGTVAVWVRATEGLDDAGFAAWRKRFAGAHADATLQGDNVTLEVAGEHGPIRLEADIVKGVRRTLAGGEPSSLLSVNGRDVGQEILGAFAK